MALLSGCATPPPPPVAAARGGTTVRVVAVRALPAASNPSARLAARALGARGQPAGFELVLRLPDGTIRDVVQKQATGLAPGRKARLHAGPLVTPED